MKHLSREMIDRSPEIQAWLRQFAEADRTTAAELLMRLSFCTRDAYASWLAQQVVALGAEHCALYAVRRLPTNQVSLWSPAGRIVHRTATARGSEDFVMSIVAQLKRVDEEKYVDHPSIRTLRSRRIKTIVFLDDSVGSGERVGSYARRFFKNASILSWWSYGKIHLHIFAMMRSEEGEQEIMERIPGGEHPARIFRKSAKVTFHGPFTYSGSGVHHRWGSQSEEILSLCKRTTQIPANRRKGYGGVMANLVFYHSVPNNIPGVLHVSNARWRALFPGRSFPAWLSNLLDDAAPRSTERQEGEIASGTLLAALALIKKGLTREVGLGRQLGVSSSHLSQVLASGVAAGLLTPAFRLTKRGLDVVVQNRRLKEAPLFDRSLYIPQSWCAGQNSVQPLPSSRRKEDRTTLRRTTREASE